MAYPSFKLHDALLREANKRSNWILEFIAESIWEPF